MAQYEALYGRKFQSPLNWCHPTDKVVLGIDMLEDSLKVVKMVQARIKAAQDRYLCRS